jgi:uncharacterized protein YbjT (DUF2867 family)
MSQHLLVTGASGQLGREAVTLLASKGWAVRAASRDPQRLTVPQNVGTVAMDYDDPASVDLALQGVDAALLIAPALDWDAPRKLAHFIRVAAKNPDFHVVFISALGVDHAESAPLRQVEHLLFKSGVRWTVLRPNFFMDNFAGGSLAQSIRQDRRIGLAASDKKTSFIAASDIAAVASECFNRKLFGKEFNLTGPAAYDHAEVAALLSSVIGTTVSYAQLPEATLRKGMLDAGVPDSVIRYLEMLYGAVRSGLMAAVTDDVMAVTGTPPTSLPDFLRRHAAVWK